MLNFNKIIHFSIIFIYKKMLININNNLNNIGHTYIKFKLINSFIADDRRLETECTTSWKEIVSTQSVFAVSINKLRTGKIKMYVYLIHDSMSYRYEFLTKHNSALQEELFNISIDNGEFQPCVRLNGVRSLSFYSIETYNPYICIFGCCNTSYALDDLDAAENQGDCTIF
jgi:hypothetical protein